MKKSLLFKIFAEPLTLKQPPFFDLLFIIIIIFIPGKIRVSEGLFQSFLMF